jgi:hypothetical protein
MFDLISSVSIVYIIHAAENLDRYCNSPHNLFRPSLVLNNFINVTVYCYCSLTNAIIEEDVHSFDFFICDRNSNLKGAKYDNVGSDI